MAEVAGGVVLSLVSTLIVGIKRRREMDKVNESRYGVLLERLEDLEESITTKIKEDPRIRTRIEALRTKVEEIENHLPSTKTKHVGVRRGMFFSGTDDDANKIDLAMLYVDTLRTKFSNMKMDAILDDQQRQGVSTLNRYVNPELNTVAETNAASAIADFKPQDFSPKLTNEMLQGAEEHSLVKDSPSVAGLYGNSFSVFHNRLPVIARVMPFDVFRKEGKTDEEALGAVRKELGILVSQCSAKLKKHDYLASYTGLAFCKEAHFFGLIMDQLVDTKGPLSAHLRETQTKISWDTRQRWSEEIRIGMLALVLAGIVHGDLRCDNIFLDMKERDLEKKHVIICNFGLTTYANLVMDRSSKFTASAGLGNTPWKAPEFFLRCKRSSQLNYSPPYSEKADVYAYGIIMWELASRDIPWRDYSCEEVAAAVSLGYTPSFDDLEVPLEYVRSSNLCCSFHPVHRPDFASLQVCNAPQDSVRLGIKSVVRPMFRATASPVYKSATPIDNKHVFKSTHLQSSGRDFKTSRSNRDLAPGPSSRASVSNDSSEEEVSEDVCAPDSNAPEAPRLPHETTIARTMLLKEMFTFAVDPNTRAIFKEHRNKTGRLAIRYDRDGKLVSMSLEEYLSITSVPGCDCPEHAPEGPTRQFF